MPRRAGRHFLQIPGPTNVPDRVLRAIDLPTMDHRGPEFADLGKAVLAGMKRVFKSTQGEVVIYPASGTGAWEAALVNTLSPGDRALMAETGHFATLWQKMAAKLGLQGRVPQHRLAPWRRPRGDHEARARTAQRNSRRGVRRTTRHLPASRHESAK
jgi:alanine-glyoxylate transaminase/serine-glyoxylate transaminase/serine-pyruvate transaminase